MMDKNGNYRFLPKQYRDFHNQKDLFKDIYYKTDYKNLDIPLPDKINWVQMHINTVDVFLYQMALRGYTLKKDSRFIKIKD